MNCKFVQWIMGTMVSWRSPTIKSNDMDTKGQWMIDHPRGPISWKPGNSLVAIEENKEFESISGQTIIVLQRIDSNGWVFHDTPGYPPRALAPGVTYEVNLDFEIRIYDASKFDAPSPEPVHTATWDFHQTYKAK